MPRLQCAVSLGLCSLYIQEFVRNILYFTFVVCNKAFNMIELWALFKPMLNVKLQVKLDEDLTTNKIPIGRMRQGDVISPKVFTLVIEDIFKNINWNSIEQLQRMLLELKKRQRKSSLK